MKTRFIMPSHDAALRLGTTQALMVLELPAGFHALPLVEQRELIASATEDALGKALRCLDNGIMPTAMRVNVANMPKKTGLYKAESANEATAA